MRLIARLIRPALLLAAASIAAGCGPSGPSSLQFVEISPAQPRLGEVVTVRFALIDSRGLPLAGQQVDFKIQGAKAGVSLSPTQVASLRGSGFAETQLVATSRVSSVIVVATAGDKTVQSPPISFAGAVPNGRQFTFQCGPLSGEGSGGRHAIGAYDPVRGLIAGVRLECTAHLGDRNGDGVAGALVSFETEAGTITPTQASKSDGIGNATVLYKTSYPLPKDVEPDKFTWSPPLGPTQTGQYIAPLWMHPFSWVPDPTVVPRPAPANNPAEPFRIDPIRRSQSNAQITNNPRDNLVAMIAVTSGEEGFSDNNNNGKYDEGDTFDPDFDDTTEPFVDANDNGTWDADERYIDTDGNGHWDGKNGAWDSSTLIWAQERILWTGAPTTEDTRPPKPILVAVNPGGVALKCPTGNTICTQAGPPTVVQFVLSDPWYNTIAQNADGDGCTVADTDGSPVKSSPKTINQGVKFTYPAGDLIGILVRDARDPLAAPADQIPPRRPDPESFSVPVVCTMTASALDGHVIQINVGSITGTIE